MLFPCPNELLKLRITVNDILSNHKLVKASTYLHRMIITELAPTVDAPLTQAGAESLALVADAAITPAFKALVADSPVAQTDLLPRAVPMVHAEAVLMAMIMDAPMICAGADELCGGRYADYNR